MKQSIFLFTLLIQSISLHALDIKVNLWERELCDAPQICLPQRITQPKLVTIPEPPMNSFSRVETYLDEHRVLFTLTKREGETPYMSFQTELYDLNGKLMAVCSRFEAISSREDFLVGACAGKKDNENLLLGVSLLIP
jgi:hypothetical protein